MEHCRIDQWHKAVVKLDAKGAVPIPCATLSLLMLGPGTRITHAAVSTLAENGCSIVWCGAGGTRFYAEGMGETRQSQHLLHQARVWANPDAHLEIVMRMYRLRFDEQLASSLTLRQVRGKEGIRVRETYARISRETGVPWKGRDYKRNDWAATDPLNRALSTANSCMYGLCHAAIVSVGLSPGLGFIHTGKMLSFVYDVADLYKTEITVPVAFTETAKGDEEIETRVRHRCRDVLREKRLLTRIIPDVFHCLGIKAPKDVSEHDMEQAAPGELWDPDGDDLVGGKNYAEVGGRNGRDGS